MYLMLVWMQSDVRTSLGGKTLPQSRTLPNTWCELPKLANCSPLAPGAHVLMFKPSIRVKVRDGHLVGEFWDCYRLEPGPVQDLRNHYEKHVAAQGKPGLAVDLGGVGFAGSTALSGFVAMRKNGIRVVFFNAEPVVREVFRVGGLESMFTFVNDEDAAIEALERPSSGQIKPVATPGLPQVRPISASGPLKRTRKEPS